MLAEDTPLKRTTIHIRWCARSAPKTTSNPASVVVGKNQKLVPLKPGEKRVAVGAGAASVGQVYRLANGELVYVVRR
jgi:hypothetical protein